jgi:predicted ATPase
MRYLLRAESFFNVAHRIEEEQGPEKGAIEAHGGTSLHEMSHGESFLTLALERFAPGGLFLLDEPEAALSPQGCLALLRRMHDLAAGGAQFVSPPTRPC